MLGALCKHNACHNYFEERYRHYYCWGHSAWGHSNYHTYFGGHNVATYWGHVFEDYEGILIGTVILEELHGHYYIEVNSIWELTDWGKYCDIVVVLLLGMVIVVGTITVEALTGSEEPNMSGQQTLQNQVVAGRGILGKWVCMHWGLCPWSFRGH